MGRAKLTVDVEAVQREAARGLAEYQVAAALGVSADTLTRCKREQAGVAEALARGKRAAVGEIENVMYECARQAREDPRYQTSAIFWLKCWAGWKERTVIETVTPDADSSDRTALAERVRALAGGVPGRDGFQAPAGDA